LVTKTLKGAGVETLKRPGPDGIVIEPLYTAETSAPAISVPASFRGVARSWDIRASVNLAAIGAANAQALDALAGGAESLLVTLGGVSRDGVAFGSADDLARVLEGVLVDVAAVAVDAGFLGPQVAGWLAATAKSAPSAPLALHLDPLSAFAAAGVSPGPIAAHVASAAKTGAALAETYPKASLFLATGRTVHESGGSPAWELAFAIAAAVTYAKALSAAGLPVKAAFERIVLGASADAAPLMTIAKMRALRVLWARITQACDAGQPACIEARSSARMLTRADRWTNLVRLTSAGFGAAVGGADAIVLGAYTDAIGPADAFASRLARNTQLILMEEAHLGRVADPAAGSWALESLTRDLASAAWGAFVEIEAAGGVTTALEGGLVATAVERSRIAITDAVADRRLRIIGVTDFRSDEAAPDPLAPANAEFPQPDPRLPGADSLCPPLAAIRLEEIAQ
jgi:methylmalonyl-CoA mutase